MATPCHSGPYVCRGPPQPRRVCRDKGLRAGATLGKGGGRVTVVVQTVIVRSATRCLKMVKKNIERVLKWDKRVIQSEIEV